MDLDDFAKGAVAALLVDQVRAKTALATKVSLAVLAASIVLVAITDGFVRWLVILCALAAIVFFLFVFASRRLATGIINRLAPPLDLANSRQHFDTAIAEADVPTGPLGFLRLIWRLRSGVGPEIERLGAVVTRLRSDLG